MKYIETKKPKAPTRPAANIKSRTKPGKSSPDWKPQPCGLSRSELREIVGEILG
jgi:hypothetical protein